jgi:hypothetical protein
MRRRRERPQKLNAKRWTKIEIDGGRDVQPPHSAFKSRHYRFGTPSLGIIAVFPLAASPKPTYRRWRPSRPANTFPGPGAARPSQRLLFAFNRHRIGAGLGAHSFCRFYGILRSRKAPPTINDSSPICSGNDPGSAILEQRQAKGVHTLARLRGSMLTRASMNLRASFADCARHDAPSASPNLRSDPSFSWS